MKIKEEKGKKKKNKKAIHAKPDDYWTHVPPHHRGDAKTIQMMQ
jgi:hypothetical protein